MDSLEVISNVKIESRVSIVKVALPLWTQIGSSQLPGLTLAAHKSHCLLVFRGFKMSRLVVKLAFKAI